MKDLLPEWLYNHLFQNYELEKIQEIRIRKNQPIQICYKGKMIELRTNSGLYLKPLCATSEIIDYIISGATKQSLYAFDDQIKNGYIVTDNGIRIGLCGTAVMNNGNVKFIKKVTSLNIRIGHNVLDCSKEIISYIASNKGVRNTLVLSSPGEGKTTMLRDIIIKLSNSYNIPNIMVIDEKFELSGENQKFNLGKNVDIMQGTDKKFAFFDAVKVMNPRVIVTDEIVSDDDIKGIKFAIKSGVSVIASVHAKNLEELKSKPFFEELIKNKYFERYIILSKRNGVGTIEGVFDENSFAIYLPYLQ